MKRFTKALAALMLTTAVICSAGCKKEPINGGNNGNDTTDTLFYTIGVAAVPSNGGSVSGGGEYKQGQSCTVTASAADGYAFSDWTEHGSLVSTDATYTFTVDGNHNLVANFTANSGGGETQHFTINTSVFLEYAGMVSGGGDYENGQSCTVTATPNSGFVFVSWSDGLNEVSTDANYTFIVSCDRNLTANFEYEFHGPTGAIRGRFSVNDNGDMVYFSQGNLQYNAFLDTWRFAEHQWDYVGGTFLFQHWGNLGENTNNNISPTYTGWIDLFGWGTSGWDCGNSYYHPWDCSYDESEIPDDFDTINDYFSGGLLYGPPGYHDLTGEYANSDWGRYNEISNGDGKWRTLTIDEWGYVFNMRPTHSGIRFVKAQIRDDQGRILNGYVLLPDDWCESYYMLYETNNDRADYSSNLILDDWSILESHGAVFLPPTGMRIWDMYSSGSDSYYWSSSCCDYDPESALFVWLSDGGIGPYKIIRINGLAVRLVGPVAE